MTMSSPTERQPTHGLKATIFFFFSFSSFLYAAKGYDNYEQIIMDLAGHIAM